MFRSPNLVRLTMPLFAFGLMITLTPGRTVWAGQHEKSAELPVDRGLMQRLSNFTLEEPATGRSHTLYGYQGRQAIVLIFMGIDCPVGNLYVPRLNEMYTEFRKKGVVFLGVNSNAHETAQDLAKYVAERAIQFPVLKDPGNLIADATLVERTCEVLVLDGFARIRYRGAIDDQYVQGKGKDAPDHNYLRDALAAVVTGQKVNVTATRVAGCLLDRAEVKAVEQPNAPRIRAAAPEVASLLAASEKEHPIEVGKVSYASDVAAIIQKRCHSVR